MAAFIGCVANGAAGQEPEREPAVSLDVLYTAELWQNLAGGLRRDAAYLDNLDLVVTADGERLLGLPETTFVASALYNNRRTFSERIVGDLQTASNIDTAGSLRLYEAWVEHRAGRAAAKAGLIDLNSEFDVNGTGALFVNSSHGIGPEFAQIGENGPGIFPITALGARIALDLGERTQLRFGVFEGVVGDPARPRRTVLRLARGEGALVVAEGEHRPHDGLRIAAGIWHHDVRSSDPAVSQRVKSTGGYSIVEARLGSVAGQPLHSFARVGVADPDIHPIASYQGVGLALGASEEQGGHQLGLAIGSVVTSRRLRADQAALGIDTDRRETAVELTWRYRPLPWLALQPDLQYVFNPGADPGLDNALAVGLRVEIGWSSAD